MDLKYFSHFIRRNFPEISNFSKEEIISLGIDFKKYLENDFRDNRSALELIWDISPLKIQLNEDHPIKLYSYNPTLVIYFGLFVEKITRGFGNAPVNLSVLES